MKKRSLVSAIVMLVVSALLLSTATYAWFASNQSVQVSTITGYVSSTDGSISISAENTANSWKSAISKTDLQYQGNTNNFSDTLDPKSFKDGSFLDGAFANDGVSFTSSADTNVNFIRYTFYLKSTIDNTACTITPTVETSNFVYVCVLADNRYYYFSSDSGSYYPITAIGQATDRNADCIIDEAEGSALVDNAQITSSNEGAIAITLGQTAKSVTVWMWAEGQDPQCIGGSAASVNNISFNITKDAVSTDQP